MAFIFSPTGSRVIENIPLEVQFNQLPDNDNYDRDRIGLISSALYIIERNYIFGVGPGLENYLKEAEGSAFAHVRNARPHNFYLSALSDFGIIGSLFLLIGFYMAIRRLTLQGFSGHLSFLLPVGFLLIFNEYILLVDIWVLYPVFLIYLKLSKLKRPSGNEYHHHRPVGC